VHYREKLTVSTKMPRKYGISTLKYPKQFWAGGTAPSPGPSPCGATATPGSAYGDCYVTGTV